MNASTVAPGARGQKRRLSGAWTSAAITGGSHGIGAAFAELLAAAGTNLTLVARSTGPLEAIATRLRNEYGVEVETIAADLADRAQTDEVAAQLAGRGELDLLVNNVGGATLGRFDEKTWADVEFELGANLVSATRLMHAVLPAMKRAGRGNIINVAAGTAFYPTPHAAVYGAAKAAVVSLTVAVGHELRGSGVKLSAICPGFTKTESQAASGIDARRVPALLWTSPEDVADAALRAALRGRQVVSPGRWNAIGALVGRHAPRSLVVPTVAWAQRRLVSP